MPTKSVHGREQFNAGEPVFHLFYLHSNKGQPLQFAQADLEKILSHRSNFCTSKDQCIPLPPFVRMWVNATA